MNIFDKLLTWLEQNQVTTLLIAFVIAAIYLLG